MSYWPLLGIAVVVIGLPLRANPVLVVTAAALVTGLAARLSPLALLEMIGAGFLKNRYLLLFALTLPVIGVLERRGLKEHAQQWIIGIRRATASRILLAYLLLRQVAAAFGLTSLGGHAQAVRPLIAPMTEAAAEKVHGPLPAATRERLAALAAGTDNIGVFFGEDIFFAFGAVLLINGFFRDAGITLEPMHIALWGIPTALAALVIHGLRLWRLERWLAREAERPGQGPQRDDEDGDQQAVAERGAGNRCSVDCGGAGCCGRCSASGCCCCCCCAAGRLRAPREPHAAAAG